jgi:hypothetical protein
MSSEPSAFFTSQVQLEPKLPTADLVNSVPVERVVPYLCRIVEDAARRFLDDLFQWQFFELGALDQVVQVGDIRLVMLTVVVFQGFLRNVRRQGVDGVRQCWQGMFHGVSFRGGLYRKGTEQKHGVFGETSLL